MPYPAWGKSVSSGRERLGPGRSERLRIRTAYTALLSSCSIFKSWQGSLSLAPPNADVRQLHRHVYKENRRIGPQPTFSVSHGLSAGASAVGTAEELPLQRDQELLPQVLHRLSCPNLIPRRENRMRFSLAEDEIARWSDAITRRHLTWYNRPSSQFVIHGKKPPISHLSDWCLILVGLNGAG